MKKFARRCDATGRGMNEGYVVGDGELYFSEKEHLLEHLRGLDWVDANGNRSADLTDDEDIMEYFYNEDYYYYTEWEEIDDEDETSTIFISKKIEVLNYKYNGTWYEIHVDATEERFIIDVFAEKGKITEELMNHFENVIKEI